jgi:hypothetical protein
MRGLASAAPTAQRRGLELVLGGLAGQDEDPAQAHALGCPDVGVRVVADHGDRANRDPAAEILAQAGDGLPEHLRRGLAEDRRAHARCVLQAGDGRAGI